MFWLIDVVIIRPIVNILFVIYNLVGDFGLAIILFTIVVKLLTWPLVKRQLQQTKLMRKIQPELAEIKKNCKGNRQMESLQMMDLYKRNNIKPFRTVLTTLIQLPIFMALFMSISAMVNPRPSADTCGYTNVYNCAYEPVRSMPRISEIISKQDEYFVDVDSAKAAAEAGEEAKTVTYSFEPKLFNLIDLSAHPADVFQGKISVSSFTILLFALGASLLQFFASRQQNPSGKSKKSKSFRQLMKETKEGKEPDQADLSALTSKQMSIMMPFMMFFIMFYLPGALVFYYMLSSAITVVQQRIALKQAEEEMEISADKAVLKELRKIKEAEVVENKKTKTKITRITARDSKKKRRK